MDNIIIDNVTFIVDSIDNITFIVVGSIIITVNFAHRDGQLKEASGGCSGGAAAHTPHSSCYIITWSILYHIEMVDIISCR